MFNVCIHCGAYGVEREIVERDAGVVAVCSSCHSDIPFQRRSIWLVTGASAVGKSTVTIELARRGIDWTILEMDILWGTIPVQGDGDLARYFDAWLRIAKNMNQGAAQPMLFGAVEPQRLESLPERCYLADVHVLALTADSDAIRERLAARPGWRAADPDFIERQVAYNAWFIENAASQRWQRVDTTSQSTAETAEAIESWALRTTANHT